MVFTKLFREKKNCKQNLFYLLSALVERFMLFVFVSGISRTVKEWHRKRQVYVNLTVGRTRSSSPFCSIAERSGYRFELDFTNLRVSRAFRNRLSSLIDFLLFILNPLWPFSLSKSPAAFSGRLSLHLYLKDLVSKLKLLSDWLSLNKKPSSNQI